MFLSSNSSYFILKCNTIPLLMDIWSYWCDKSADTLNSWRLFSAVILRDNCVFFFFLFDHFEMENKKRRMKGKNNSSSRRSSSSGRASRDLESEPTIHSDFGLEHCKPKLPDQTCESGSLLELLNSHFFYFIFKS